LAEFWEALPRDRPAGLLTTTTIHKRLLMNREETLALVREFTKNENLVRHMLAVEAGMRAYAHRFGEDEESWGRVGLLHDFDWEIHPTLDEHPTKGAPILRERGVEEEDIRTILSHGYETGVPRETLRDKALYAVDELTGLITAVAAMTLPVSEKPL
jgi:putative nucleotidyltransferase with HDIG domain